MRPIIALLLLLARFLVAQPSDPAGELTRAYSKHTVRLLTPLSGDSVGFDSDGHPVKGKPGVAGMDDYIRVGKVKLEKAGAVIEGTRAPMMVNPSNGKITFGVGKFVRLTLAVPSQSVEAVEAGFAKVLVPTGGHSCTEMETAEFAATLEVKLRNQDGSTAGSEMVCIPTGDRGYWGGKGMVPGKAVETPDPEFPSAIARQGLRGWQGKIALIVLIDEKGVPRDAITVEGPDVSLLYERIGVIRQWRFRPATKDGVPVPWIILVEFNLRS